jgi:hypothetical protein
MTPVARLAAAAAVFSLSPVASASSPEKDEAPAAQPSKGDLFPTAGRATAAAATGVPFLGIAEIGYAFTDGFALGAIGGVALAYVPNRPTPSVPTAGIRPRLRIATSQHTSLVLIAPMLWYPSATPGPSNDGGSSWLVARPEVFLDGAVGRRWHVAGGTGVIAAAATEALGQLLGRRTVVMPPYNASTASTKGFAGGIWNTLSSRTSYMLSERTHLFAEATLVLMGISPAEVGGPPVVVTLGAQHTF